MIQQADCQAVLLHDPHRRAIAAVHCGWRGSVVGIIGKTIAAMQRYYRSIPADLTAFIGPSLGPCCGEFINYPDELPRWMHQYQVRPSYFDFWEISRQQLLGAGEDKLNTIRARRIGMVFQQFNLFPHLTVLRNLTIEEYREEKARAAP